MKYFILIFLFLILTTSYSCKNGSNSKVGIEQKKTPDKAPKPTVQKVKKELDSLNNKNTVAFLKKYGELNKENKVIIKTRLGNIKIKLYEETPLHRASFIFLTKVGYFDTTCFYRVVPGFIIQGGESERIDTQNIRAKYFRYKLPSEFKANIKHRYGAVAAARDWKNNPQKKSTPFEFYIVQNKKGAHHLDGEHTVFGQVISGFDVIDKIVNLKTGSDEWPLQDVFMKVEILK